LDTNETAARGRGRSPSLAATLSFLWPGLGQFYMRNRRAAAVFALPAVLALVLLAYELRQGPVVFVARFVDPAFSRTAAVLVILLGAWRIAAVAHAFLGGDRIKAGRQLDRAVVIALAAVIVISHGGAGFLLAETSAAAEHPFATPGASSIVDLTTPPPTTPPSLEPSATAEPTATPIPTPSIDGRVTILLTGAGQERPIQYDSIMVVSYDPVTNSVQMVSIPRDSIYFPLYFGKHAVVSSFRINSLPRYAKAIGSPDSPYMTLVNQVSYLVGIHIDYYAALDITVFIKLIDMVGGIDVVNPSDIVNPYYDWLDGNFGFNLAAGPQHLDGRTALAYVRSRESAGDNDFGRSSRQQEVLVDLLHKMAQPAQILNLPGLISTLFSAAQTSFPADKVADYVAIGQNIPKENFTQVVLSPSDGYSTYSGSAICLYNSKVAALSVQLFGKDSLWSGKRAPAGTCP
jgi:LCP family protein required for cell wall assembly